MPAQSVSAARRAVTSPEMFAQLRRLEGGFRARWSLLILAGAAFCLIGPVLFGTFIWLHQFQERRSAGTEYSWLNRVIVTGLVFLPILFAIEWATRGKMLEEGAEALGDSMRLPGVRGAGQGLVILEMCLWGPRMVIGGTRKLLGLSQHRRADRALAAEMVATLANRGEGIPTAQLYPLAKNDDAAFGDALGYLLFHDLIGISKAGDRAWLLSDARRALRLG